MRYSPSIDYYEFLKRAFPALRGSNFRIIALFLLPILLFVLSKRFLGDKGLIKVASEPIELLSGRDNVLIKERDKLPFKGIGVELSQKAG